MPDDTCARCGGAFRCGANDPAPCACTSIRLDAPTLAGLRERYSGCLCLRCLAELAAAPGTAEVARPASRSTAAGD